VQYSKEFSKIEYRDSCDEIRRFHLPSRSRRPKDGIPFATNRPFICLGADQFARASQLPHAAPQLVLGKLFGQTLPNARPHARRTDGQWEVELGTPKPLNLDEATP
jgi:hypothetical protein